MTSVDEINISNIPVWNGKGTNSEYKRWSILVTLKLAKKGSNDALKRDLSSSADTDERKMGV